MDVLITIAGESASAETRSLYQWLVAEGDLRGAVRLDQALPAPGTLGGFVDALVVGLAPSGVATALASVLIAWLRRRTGNLTMKITRPDGSSVELAAEHVRRLDSDQVRELVEEQSRLLLARTADDSPIVTPLEDPTAHG